MGQRMPDVPHIYDANCLRGFDLDKTPKYAYARFSMIETCPGVPLLAPNDRTFKLTQDDVNPCKWEYLSNDYCVIFRVWPDPLLTSIALYPPPIGKIYFYGWEPGKPNEGTVYNNVNLFCGVEEWGIKGIATVTWIHEATALLESINMQRADDLFMEMRPLADGNKVYKFCRLKDGTNIAIEFEPD